mgnify:CR=1 FL=1|jgi:hypothetical protein
MVVALFSTTAIFKSTMNRRPISPKEKFAQATALWLFTVLLSIPLWDLASLLFSAYRFGSLHSLVEIFLKPAGTIAGLMLMFAIVAEHGIGSIAERYWPAFLIASAFTALILRGWWRRS